MSNLSPTTSEVFVRDPEHARFICEVLADCAATVREYNHRRAYQALRSLTPDELFSMYRIHRDQGNAAFREAFGSVYHRAQGHKKGHDPKRRTTHERSDPTTSPPQHRFGFPPPQHQTEGGG
jgi:hypothetical protein